MKLAFALRARPGWLVERVIGAVADRVKAARFEPAFSHPPTDYDGATRVAILSMPRRLEPFAAFLAIECNHAPAPGCVISAAHAGYQDRDARPACLDLSSWKKSSVAASGGPC